MTTLQDIDLQKALQTHRILDHDGNLVGPDPHLPRELLLDIYHNMVKARIIDQWLLKLQRMGRVAIHAPNKGQEAASVASAITLHPQDWLFPSYRELGALLVRGMTIEEIFDRALANRDDPLKGGDFAIYGHKKYNIVPAPVPVGNQILHATGAAMAAKIMRHPTVTMTYFGEGATSRGDFHAAMNFAGVYQAPVVFVNQNNQWAISLPLKRQTRAPTIAVKAIAYGFQGIRVDGNDPLAVYTTAKEAVEKARKGGGPTLIEALTYRLGPHTTADDPTKYREPAEAEEWEKREPIRRFKAYLISQGILTEKEDAQLWETLEKTVEETVVKCLEKPGLPPEVIIQDVYTTPPWNLQEQLAETLESLELMPKLGLDKTHH